MLSSSKSWSKWYLITSRLDSLMILTLLIPMIQMQINKIKIYRLIKSIKIWPKPRILIKKSIKIRPTQLINKNLKINKCNQHTYSSLTLILTYLQTLTISSRERWSSLRLQRKDITLKLPDWTTEPSSTRSTTRHSSKTSSLKLIHSKKQGLKINSNY